MYLDRSKDSNNELVSQAIARNKFEFILSKSGIWITNLLKMLMLKRNTAQMKPWIHTQVDMVVSSIFMINQFVMARYDTRLYILVWALPRCFYKYQWNLQGAGCWNLCRTCIRRRLAIKNGETKNLICSLINFFFHRFVRKSGEKDIYGTGAIRENRIPGSTLRESKEMKKTIRGSYDFIKIMNRNIIFIQYSIQ